MAPFQADKIVPFSWDKFFLQLRKPSSNICVFGHGIVESFGTLAGGKWAFLLTDGIVGIIMGYMSIFLDVCLGGCFV